jgi:hypothetical protein
LMVIKASTLLSWDDNWSDKFMFEFSL